MKTKMTISSLLLGLSLISFAAEDPIPEVAIDYFGLIPPGDTPELFQVDGLSEDVFGYLSPTFSPDGKECFIALIKEDGDLIELNHTQYVDGEWSTIEPSDILPTKTGVMGPTLFSNDGNKVTVIVYDEEAEVSLKLNVSEKLDGVWEAATPVGDGPGLANSYGASITSDGSMYACVDGDMEYYEMVDGEYRHVHKMGPMIDYGDFVGGVNVSPDGDYMIFSASGRDSNTYGYEDLFISYKNEDGSWSNRKNLGNTINKSGGANIYGKISPDGKYLFYFHYIPGNNNDINNIIPPQVMVYWVSTSFVDELRTANSRPYLNTPLEDETYMVDEDFSYEIPATAFVDEDIDNGDFLTFSVKTTTGKDLPEWFSFDPLTGEMSGKATEEITLFLYVKAVDQSGKMVEDIVKLIFEPNPNSSIKDLIAKSISVYPNPVNNLIYLQIDDEGLRMDSYQILSVSGCLNKAGEGQQSVIDVSDLNAGIYLLQLNTNKGVINKRIIKQ